MLPQLWESTLICLMGAHEATKKQVDAQWESFRVCHVLLSSSWSIHSSVMIDRLLRGGHWHVLVSFSYSDRLDIPRMHFWMVTCHLVKSMSGTRHEAQLWGDRWGQQGHCPRFAHAWPCQPSPQTLSLASFILRNMWGTCCATWGTRVC